MAEPLSRTRKLTIIAQDPSVKGFDGKILKTQIEIPAEDLAKGPRGYRVAVIDYDTSTGKFYRADCEYQDIEDGQYIDPFKKAADLGKDQELLEDPRFHCQNAYAIVMRTLARFEFALGRRVNWGFNGHQIHIAPHAFSDANAFYTEKERALCFGYFRTGDEPKERKIVFTSLSHDVVAHESTHAILDGLRERYTDPSSPDQAGFHEGFSDIVALLSVFSLRDVVGSLVPDIQEIGRAGERGEKGKPAKKDRKKDLQYITKKYLTEKNLRQSILFGLAEEMGQELSGVRGQALRRSSQLEPRDPDKAKVPYSKDPDFQEPHRRGELLVAAVMNSFLSVWLSRLDKYTGDRNLNDPIDKDLIVDEGASAADHLLTLMIRALDYTPPTDLRFSDFLSAALTADTDLMPDDSKYHYRRTLIENFRNYGIEPASSRSDGTWRPCIDEKLCYERTHFESLLRDPIEVFRFIWDNRGKLFSIDASADDGPARFEDAYTQVQWVRPSLRIAPDGFAVKETVASYIQMVTLRADELRSFDIDLPDTMPPETEVRLYGGGTLIFNEYGKLKYHIRNRIFNSEKQSERLQYLWATGYFNNQSYRENLFSRMHIQKTLGMPMRGEEQF